MPQNIHESVEQFQKGLEKIGCNTSVTFDGSKLFIGLADSSNVFTLLITFEDAKQDSGSENWENLLDRFANLEWNASQNSSGVLLKDSKDNFSFLLLSQQEHRIITLETNLSEAIKTIRALEWRVNQLEEKNKNSTKETNKNLKQRPGSNSSPRKENPSSLENTSAPKKEENKAENTTYSFVFNSEKNSKKEREEMDKVEKLKKEKEELEKKLSEVLQSKEDIIKENLVENILLRTDDFHILGCQNDSSKVEVRKAFQKLSLGLHPDKNKSLKAEEAFKKMSESYQRIMNGIEKEEKRKEDIEEKRKRDEEMKREAEKKKEEEEKKRREEKNTGFQFTAPFQSTPAFTSTPFGGSSTPAFGASTPFGGSSTPAFSTSTPFGGSSTPAFGTSTPFGGSSTPAFGTSTPFGGTTHAFGANFIASTSYLFGNDDEVVCYRCGTPGHYANRCYRSVRDDDIVCYRCGTPGHYSNRCYRR